MKTIETRLHPIETHAEIGDRLRMPKRGWSMVASYWRAGRYYEIVAYTNDHWYALDSSGRRIRREYYLRIAGIIHSPPYYSARALINNFHRYGHV